MRLFVYEHITGGGLINQPLPASLAREGELMLRALVNDLTDIPGVEVAVMRDPRLPALDQPVITMTPRGEEELWAMFRQCMEMADAVWPIAPEQAGLLERLSRMAWENGKRLVGSHPDAVRIAASKMATAQLLSRAGVPVVETFSDIACIPADAGKIVVKPDDGAGCLDTYLFDDHPAARSWLKIHGDENRYIVQPYADGDPLSLSVLCWEGHARLLSCNRQHIQIKSGRLCLTGLSVNAVRDDGGAYSLLAGRIAAAMPGLWGYVGIDLVRGQDGPIVVEVNPRLTTSYAGLRRALGCNPADLVLALPGMVPHPGLDTPQPAQLKEVSHDE